MVVAHAALAAESARRELLEAQREENAEEEANKKSWAKWKRNMYVGGAAVAGGALLAVTGGKHRTTGLCQTDDAISGGK